jgi:Recombinase zinc beta ribbon domain
MVFCRECNDIFHKTRHGKAVDGSRYRVHRQDNIVVGTRDKPNHPALIDPGTFELVQQKIAANRKKTSVTLYMATGLLRCPVCGTPMHVKYSSASGYRATNARAAKYTCPKKPLCSQKRMLISETHDRLWGALVELLVRPELIHELVAPEPKNDIDALRKELAKTEREQKALQEKQARLLDLYLEGNVPQASYVVKTTQLEQETEALAQARTSIQQKIQANGKNNGVVDLIQTLSADCTHAPGSSMLLK